jgi:hypothetical protein
MKWKELNWKSNSIDFLGFFFVSFNKQTNKQRMYESELEVFFILFLIILFLSGQFRFWIFELRSKFNLTNRMSLLVCFSFGFIKSNQLSFVCMNLIWLIDWLNLLIFFLCLFNHLIIRLNKINKNLSKIQKSIEFNRNIHIIDWLIDSFLELNQKNYQTLLCFVCLSLFDLCVYFSLLILSFCLFVCCF